MLDFVADYWNDAMTIASFTLALIIAYYQIQHYRAQSPQINITEVENPSYAVRVRTEGYGNLSPANNLVEDDLVDSYYTAHVSVENPGREEVTISGAELHVSDTEERLEMLNRQRRSGLTSQSIRIGSVDSETIYYRAIGEVRENGHPSSVDCTVVLESPAGDVSETVSFEREN